MHPLRPLSLIALSLTFLLSACLPKIGDDCVNDIDCAQQRDRLCDTTQPGGYCTIADCNPTSCPEKESVCVAFGNVRSTVGVCNDPGVSSPHRRNFCMATCDSDEDCRAGYACVDLSEPNPWGAEVIQKLPNPNKRRETRFYKTTVCVIAVSNPEIEESRRDDFCAIDSLGAAGAPQ